MEKAKEMIKNILFILIIIMLFKILISYELAKTEYDTYEYVVMKNDTLWNIASNICDNNDVYIRKVIIDIKQINDMNNSTIYVGQTIKLPIYN
jgi:hypothetical protein